MAYSCPLDSQLEAQKQQAQIAATVLQLRCSMKLLDDSEGGWPNTVDRFLRQMPVSQAASKVRRHLEQRVKVSAMFSRCLFR